MKVRINRQELSEALAAASAVAATRTPKPILECVLIEAAGDHCLLVATDLEIAIRATVAQVEIEEKGTVVVHADKLAQIVRESSDEVLSLDSDDSMCHVRGKDAHYQIVALDPADFPAVAELEGEPDFEIENSVLRRMSEWTVFAAAREHTRYAINGVLWEKQKDALALVATDGRRLALAKAKISGAGQDWERIVPSKAMHVFPRILGDASGKVAVKLTGNQIIVKTARATLCSGLVEGQFPKYRDVVPSDCDRKVTLNTSELLSAVRRSALLTNEESKGVRLAFADNMLTLTSRAPSQGEATITIPIKYSHDELVIGFNPHFIIDALKVVDEDEVTIELKSSNRPGLFKCGADRQYVVMPVSLS
jgi:DNA polymerase-3 subunit beta